MASASSTMLKTCWAADIVGYVMLVLLSLFRDHSITRCRRHTCGLLKSAMMLEQLGTSFSAECLFYSQMSLYCYKSFSLMIRRTFVQSIIKNNEQTRKTWQRVNHLYVLSQADQAVCPRGHE